LQLLQHLLGVRQVADQLRDFFGIFADQQRRPAAAIASRLPQAATQVSCTRSWASAVLRTSWYAIRKRVSRCGATRVSNCFCLDVCMLVVRPIAGMTSGGGKSDGVGQIPPELPVRPGWR
jgi:hypothetical protein